MAKKYFEEYEVNQIAKTPGRTITEADVINFAGVSGDFNKLHTDKEYMKNSKFGRRLVHGLLVYSMARGLIFRMENKPETIAFYGIDKIRFVKPVFIDDTIRVEEKVVKKKKRNDESGIITFEDKIFNHKGETVLVAYPRLLVARERNKADSRKNRLR